ncbi:hypothetical protein H5410_042783 [Solanum commersonii]|uniref:Uncharacterized protein n=1 Tax=Solanum commersonii TaxID=4109 RepID=A0A9J5XWM6_SOLCO|nr:hypothetical protein H5410_042783 [Solanum commersonii]
MKLPNFPWLQAGMFDELLPFQRVVAALQNASFEKRDMARDSCLARVTVGVVVGGAVGGAGTYEAVSFKVSRLLKIRYIGQTTLRRATIFDLFLGAGSLIHRGKFY